MTLNHLPPRQFDISLVHKTYNLFLLFHSYARVFPKNDRHSVGQKSENLILEILELLFLANSKQKRSRILILNKIDIKLKILKVIIRLCFDVRAINQNKYIVLQEKILEIGRMLGGWIKDTKENPAKNPAG